jgi:hypothetical protein
MDAIEGRRDVGQLGTKNKFERLIDLAQKDSEGLGNWAGDEFDGIRSEMDFRRAMALEEERLRGTLFQRVLRTLNAVAASLRSSHPLRLLR